MSDSNGRSSGATEIIQLPRPSWAPLFFAGGLTLVIAGLYIEFMGPNWAYVVIGLAFVLSSLRSMIKASKRDFYRLPRRQEISSAPLATTSIEQPKRSN